jgi:hypothetical protein
VALETTNGGADELARVEIDLSLEPGTDWGVGLVALDRAVLLSGPPDEESPPQELALDVDFEAGTERRMEGDAPRAARLVNHGTHNRDLEPFCGSGRWLGVGVMAASGGGLGSRFEWSEIEVVCPAE